jgi:hypothetical protein
MCHVRSSRGWLGTFIFFGLWRHVMWQLVTRLHLVTSVKIVLTRTYEHTFTRVFFLHLILIWNCSKLPTNVVTLILYFNRNSFGWQVFIYNLSHHCNSHWWHPCGMFSFISTTSILSLQYVLQVLTWNFVLVFTVSIYTECPYRDFLEQTT